MLAQDCMAAPNGQSTITTEHLSTNTAEKTQGQCLTHKTHYWRHCNKCFGLVPFVVGAPEPPSNNILCLYCYGDDIQRSNKRLITSLNLLVSDMWKTQQILFDKILKIEAFLEELADQNSVTKLNVVTINTTLNSQKWNQPLNYNKKSIC